jgi:hypothetical protein
MTRGKVFRDAAVRQFRETASESEVGPVGFRDGEGKLGLTKEGDELGDFVQQSELIIP